MTAKLMTAAGLAMLGVLATVVSASEPAKILNVVEVQRLLDSDHPADHARLRDHFLGVAAAYELEAARHEARSRGLVGNPNRGWISPAGTHFARLAAQSRSRAVTVTGLVAHHERVAAGGRSTPPTGSAAFESGQGARVPTRRDLRQLTATVRVPADDLALEEYYLNVAGDHHATIARHAAMASTFRASAARRAPGADPGLHCDRVITRARRAERDARARALMHRQLANIG